jgi:hypothetical protein
MSDLTVCEGDAMGENDREIKAIAELMVHIQYMRTEIQDLRAELRNVATQDDIKQLRREIEANAPSTFFKSVTHIAVGIVSVGAAVGVIIAFLKYAKAI